MKRFPVALAMLFSLILIGLIAAPAAFAQNGCEFNIVGTWKVSGETSQELYRFAPEGTLTILSGQSAQPRQIAQAAYSLDNSGAPKSIIFTNREGGGVLAPGTTTMQIVSFDDRSFTARGPKSSEVRWIRDDPNRYFLVLAGHRGVFFDKSGPTFPMLIRTDGHNTDVAAVGIYSIDGVRAFGVIPKATYEHFMKESKDPDDVMFRLEISGAQYERSMKTMRIYERRVNEHELLYTDPFLNNILLVKDVTEGLNLCQKTIKLYSLDWGFTDYISEQNLPSVAPLVYFQELKRLNLALHVPDEKFLVETGQTIGQHSGK